MNVIRKKIEKVIYSDEKSRFSSAGFFLFIASSLYGVLVRGKNRLYGLKIFGQKRLKCKVISTGNITVGGTGKTPMTIYLAEKLSAFGYKIVVISRGYKGKFEKKGGVVSNGKEILAGADCSGDEPFLMAAKLKEIPVVVGRNRYHAGLLAIRNFNPDIIILDDGFQHRKLFRDIDFLLLDSNRPFGNSRVLPGGILREPVDSIGRADAFILTRSFSDNAAAFSAIRAVSDRQPVFEAYNTFYFFRVPKGGVSNNMTGCYSQLSEDFTPLAGKQVVAFSGIAGNDHFRKTLFESGCDIAEFFSFSDHHRYSEDDIEEISGAINDKGAELVMTTEKDFARMGGRFDFPVDLVVVGVKMCFKDDDSFIAFLQSRL